MLIDALGAIHDGPRAVEDLRAAMAEILACFRPGPRSWLAPILGRRIDRILFAATKADHLHHRQHGKLAAIAEALVRDARARAAVHRRRHPRALDRQPARHRRGRPSPATAARSTWCAAGSIDTGDEAALFPGNLPDDPAAILSPARQGAGDWTDAAYRVTRFAPPLLAPAAGDGLPHIRLDRAAEFLIGDRLG